MKETTILVLVCVRVIGTPASLRRYAGRTERGFGSGTYWNTWLRGMVKSCVCVCVYVYMMRGFDSGTYRNTWFRGMVKSWVCCVCVCMYVCMYVCMCICIHSCVHNKRLWFWHVSKYVVAGDGEVLYVCMCVRVCMYVCVNVYMHIYIIRVLVLARIEIRGCGGW